MAYLIFKLVHVFAVILFLGNIIIAVFWKSHGDRSEDPRIMAHTIRGIIRADRFFTMPAVAFLILAGFGAMGIGYIPFETGWILWPFYIDSHFCGCFYGKSGSCPEKIIENC